MKIKTSLTFFISITVIIVLFFLAACLKQSAYAQPVSGNDTDSLISIKAFRKLHTMGNVEYITKSMGLEATIVANETNIDESVRKSKIKWHHCTNQITKKNFF